MRKDKNVLKNGQNFENMTYKIKEVAAHAQ